jgi:hypothetical protein
MRDNRGESIQVQRMATSHGLGGGERGWLGLDVVLGGGTVETGFRGWDRRVGAGGGEVEGGARDEVCAPRDKETSNFLV